MFCPLCQSEYRDGISSCLDCHLALVGTLSEAETKNTQLWKGEDQRQLDEILSALDGIGVPRYYKEEISPVPGLRWSSVLPARPVYKLQVRVLKDDLPRAASVCQYLQNENDAVASPDVLSWPIQKMLGVSFVLALVSFFGLVSLALDHLAWQRQLDHYVIQGPVFRVGVLVGKLFHCSDDTNELIGAATDVFALMSLWLLTILLIDRFRPRKQDSTIKDNS